MKRNISLLASVLFLASLNSYSQLPKEYSLQIPPAETVFLNDTQDGEWGMGVVVWSIHVDGVNIDRELEENVYLYRDGELIRTLSPALDTEISITSVVGGVVGNGSEDLIDPTVNNQVQFSFARQNANSDIENRPDPDYLISGVYQMVVPDGLFIVTDEEDNVTRLPGAVVTYNYVNEIQENNTIIITPEDKSVIKDLKQISISFPNVKNVNSMDYESYGGATLYYVKEGSPEGYLGIRLQGGRFPLIDRTEKAFIYSYPDERIEWNDGVYTFTIAANTLKIDNVLYDEPITAVYYIGNGDSKVKLINGLDAENLSLYTVYSADGNLIVKGSASVLLSLPRGFYIINGQKVVIK